MKQLRIVALCSSSLWGGNEKWVLRSCEVMKRRGHAVTLVVRQPDMFNTRLQEKLDIIPVRMRNDGDFGSVLRLVSLFNARADVVILSRVRDYWLGGLAARLAGVKSLIRLGVVRQLRKYHIMDRLRYGVLPSSILVNAGAIKEVLVSTPWIRQNDVYVIYNGVDAPGPFAGKQREELRRELGVKASEILIAGVGRLAVEKRWTWLIWAAADLKRRSIPAAVRIIGEGNEYGPLMNEIESEGVSGLVQLTGPRQDADQCIGAADIMALSSANEGLSNSMLEAMGQTVPVVATESGGVTERFADGKNILLVGRNDFNGFCEKLRQAAKEIALRERIGMGGFETVKQEFGWERMGEELETLLLGVSGRRN